jgi:glutathione S-transferase
MKLYGHPWSINTRKVLATLAETGTHADLVLVMLPKGEHKRPEHLRLHPFGKVPVLDDGGFVLYETRAINAYIDAKAGSRLTPATARERARMDQIVGVAEAYFAPHVHPLIVELLFRRFLGGEPNAAAIAAGRAGLATPLDAIDRVLATSPFLAGDTFSLADLHWMPYLDYLSQIGEGGPIEARAHVHAWWTRISARPAWQQTARTGPQPYEPGATQEAIEHGYR